MRRSESLRSSEKWEESTPGRNHCLTVYQFLRTVQLQIDRHRVSHITYQHTYTHIVQLKYALKGLKQPNPIAPLIFQNHCAESGQAQYMTTPNKAKHNNNKRSPLCRSWRACGGMGSPSIFNYGDLNGQSRSWQRLLDFEGRVFILFLVRMVCEQVNGSFTCGGACTPYLVLHTGDNCRPAHNARLMTLATYVVAHTSTSGRGSERVDACVH